MLEKQDDDVLVPQCIEGRTARSTDGAREADRHIGANEPVNHLQIKFNSKTFISMH